MPSNLEKTKSFLKHYKLVRVEVDILFYELNKLSNDLPKDDPIHILLEEAPYQHTKTEPRNNEPTYDIIDRSTGEIVEEELKLEDVETFILNLK